eukprot:Lithocolla_globosa_v1_NODE_265_length_4744_cov_7.305396.p5 type:complete len:173 gc:universal NODE_265_length_4744_cov_7.305396:3215-3733(+)
MCVLPCLPSLSLILLLVLVGLSLLALHSCLLLFSSVKIFDFFELFGVVWLVPSELLMSLSLCSIFSSSFSLSGKPPSGVMSSSFPSGMFSLSPLSFSLPSLSLFLSLSVALVRPFCGLSWLSMESPSLTTPGMGPLSFPATARIPFLFPFLVLVRRPAWLSRPSAPSVILVV